MLCLRLQWPNQPVGLVPSSQQQQQAESWRKGLNNQAGQPSAAADSNASFDTLQADEALHSATQWHLYEHRRSHMTAAKHPY